MDRPIEKIEFGRSDLKITCIHFQYKYSLDNFKTPDTILLILEQNSVVLLF